MVAQLKIWAVSARRFGQVRLVNFSYVLYTNKSQILFYHLLINLKIISYKSCKSLKDLQQKYRPLKKTIGSVHFLIDQRAHIL